MQTTHGTYEMARMLNVVDVIETCIFFHQGRRFVIRNLYAFKRWFPFKILYEVTYGISLYHRNIAFILVGEKRITTSSGVE